MRLRRPVGPVPQASSAERSNPAHRVAGFAAAALLAAALVIDPAALPFPSAPRIPVASAACPGAEVVFARGREEPPGVGFVGDAFVNSLQGKAHMPVGAYGVNYPADVDPAKGANDMSARVQSMAKYCPNTREVLGGYSLGAVAADLVVAVTRPGFGFSNPCRPAWTNTSQRSRCLATAPGAFSARSPISARPSPARRSTSAQAATRSVRMAQHGRRICSRRTSTPDWSIRPPASRPAGCSELPAST